MGRKLSLLLLIAVCAAVVALAEMLIARQPGPPVEPDLEVAARRLDIIERELGRYASEHDGQLPESPSWAEEIGLSGTEVLDPFHLPDQPAPFGYWSDGTWYVLTSIGPDVRTAVAMAPQSLDPEATLESVRQFTLEHFEHRTPEEVMTLLALTGSPEETIVGDVRFRDAIYDPTNGIISQGDIVRRGGRFTFYDPTNGTVSGDPLRVRQ